MATRKTPARKPQPKPEKPRLAQRNQTIKPGLTYDLPIGDVLPDPDNENIHPPAQIEMLRASLRMHGQQVAIVIGTDRMALVGHGVQESMLLEGMKTIRCTVSALTGADRAAYRIADNQLGRLSYFDEAIMRANILGLKNSDPAALGFESAEWFDLINGPFVKAKDIDAGALADYHASEQLFNIKVPGIPAGEKDRIVGSITAALAEAKLDYEVKAF